LVFSLLTGCTRAMQFAGCAREVPRRLASSGILVSISNTGAEELEMIRKLKSGEYRLYSRKKDPRSGRRRNLGTFPSRRAAEAHEGAVQFFKQRG